MRQATLAAESVFGAIAGAAGTAAFVRTSHSLRLGLGAHGWHDLLREAHGGF